MATEKTTKKTKKQQPLWLRIILSLLCVGAILSVLGGMTLGVVTYRLWSKLPDLSAVVNYNPQIPLRIYSADGVLLSEFGTERREFIASDEVPLKMKLAILAAEDDRFYEHNGVSWYGVARAIVTDLKHGKKTQGASTITMQVARNFYLTKEKSYIRKFYELLLTYKIEKELSKEEILNLYMNQIFLGHRSYGFATAAKTYFGTKLQDVTLAQAAMLAGLPKAPSAYNPKTNFKRAKIRQEYILKRMYKLQYITQEEYEQAINEKLVIKRFHSKHIRRIQRENEGVSELVRQLIYNTYQENTYNRGLNVYTTIRVKDQTQAYNAVRQGVMQFNQRHGYPGPDGYVKLSDGIEHDEDAWDMLFEETHKAYPDSGDLSMGIVLSASSKQVQVKTDKSVYLIKGRGLGFVKRSLSSRSKHPIKRGSVVYIYQKQGQSEWYLTNKPAVQAAFIAVNPQTGAIESIVGGFEPSKNFNRAVQAWRQPGSTFKPFIYTAAIERGLTPETVVSDQPYLLTEKQTGNKAWRPKNYGNKYEPYLTLRNGLYRSKNMVSIRLLEAIGQPFAYEFIERFGFDSSKQPIESAYLTMALGSGSVTPLQMATAYSVFANGGYRVTPYLIDYVTDSTGAVIMKSQPVVAGENAPRVLDTRVAWIANNLLHGVATSGTGARTESTFKRGDIGAKTGTTNNSVDAWFVGYTPNVVGTAWIGYDKPKTLGRGETGSKAAMPIWMGYMRQAFKEKPVVLAKPMPRGITVQDGNYYLSEYPPGIAVMRLGVPDDVILDGEELPLLDRPTNGRKDPLNDLFQNGPAVDPLQSLFR